MQPPTVAAQSMKEQVVDAVPKRIKELKFGILSTQDIVNQGVLEVCDRALYDLDRNRAPRTNGPLDGRMGISSKTGFCETCNEPLQLCNGHFGHVRLALPAFHIGYFKMIITILQEICKDCSRILLQEPERRSFLRDLRRPNIDNLRKSQICKKILDQCKKTRECPSCGAINGVVKKAGQHPLKIIHDRFRAFNNSAAANKTPPKAKTLFDQSFDVAKKINSDVDKHLKKAMDDMNPLRVLNLFRKITPSDCELLGMHPAEGRPEMFIWQFVPAPPVCIRPSVAQDTASTEDDITSKLSDIVHISTLIKEGLRKGQPVATIMEQWDFLQIQVAMYINSDVPGLQQPGVKNAMRGFCQRLKGKQGRFRGNLSGKRVDFSGRTVISPDPNLGIDQVAIPELVAKNLTYPEKVSRYNRAKLQTRVRNGPNKWPGANYIWKKDQDIKQFLKYGKLRLHADHLQEGDIVERHLEDNDIVLFNRQPSLHKLSILSHYVKVRPHRTFRLNECVCNPYNADFDGDEMNIHVPQTEEARTEAIELMGVKNNLCTPKNGEPIISAIQDFITASYLLSSKNNFYDRKTFAHICMYMVDGDMHLDLPPPTIFKPVMLWTGKQIFNVLMRPNKATNVLINLDAACREYRAVAGQPRDLDKNDGWLCIRNSEVMCGVMDKSTIGSGKKDSVFYVTLRDYGPDAAVQSMNRLAKLSARWLTNQGFSIGISDVYPGGKLIELKTQLVERAYAECDALIVKYKDGKLAKASGCDEEQTMENLISGILSKVRQQAGDHCISELSRWNSPLIMATSGSKGSNINVSQMVAVVGQQIIGGKRVADGFQDRSLPHFPKNARQPPSKGFVRNSFFSGLTPTEFLFHAISGREGLVDTAVKTAETGYMSRRLMKSLEDLSSQYDDTVRNSSSNVIQFQYGDDKLDPVDMEGKAKPVHFDRTFTHAENTTWDNDDRSLLPWEILDTCEELLAKERKKLTRTALGGEILEYSDCSLAGIDQLESARDFLDEVGTYVRTKTMAQVATRERLGLPSELSKSSGSKWRSFDPKFQVETARASIDRTAKLSKAALIAFVKACLIKYKRAQVEPGHAVGAVGAQSIGEPGTQMTLKTFHFAGVAGMSITQGVPRIKEIINASKVISTPVISCELVSSEDIIAARVVKGRIEKTFLKDIVYYIEDCHSADQYYLTLKLDYETIGRLQLDVTTFDVVEAIKKQKKLKLNDNNIKAWKDVIRIQIESGGPSTAVTTRTPRKAVRAKTLCGAKTLSEAVTSKVLNKAVKSQATSIIKSKYSGKSSKSKAPGEVSKSKAPGKATKTKTKPSGEASNSKASGKVSRSKAAGEASKTKSSSRTSKTKDLSKASKSKNPAKISKSKALGKTSKSKDNGKATKAKAKSKVKPTNRTRIRAQAQFEPQTEPASKAKVPMEMYQRLQAIKRVLPDIVIRGYPEASRAIIKTDDKNHNALLVEGYGLRACMTTDGVNGFATKTNSVMEMREVLGIEAARKTIVDEIGLVMGDMDIDPRHMQLLADVMTYKGEILGITRFGLSKMRDSVLQLASFEKTPDHLFEAAWKMKTDKIEGVSECIIMGQSMRVGTGAFQVVRKLNLKEGDLCKKPTIFEECYNEMWPEPAMKR